MKKPKIIFIHGNGGSTGKGGWQSYAVRRLKGLGFNAINPTFPDNIEAKESVWLPYLQHELKVDEHTLLVGHSSGAVAALRYAEKHPIYASILIGVCHTDLGLESEKVSGYYDRPWNWQAIKKHQHWTAILASTDDPFIPISEARFVQKQLGCEYHEFSDLQHFGYPNDLATLPELVQIIKRRVEA